jgi:PPK2 family polyphosphate:nucleotide phosphotransferase
VNAKQVHSRYRVAPGKPPAIDGRDAGEAALFDGNKEEGTAAMTPISRRIEELQELLYAEGKRRVLIVLQGMDTSGKDGVIRKVFEGVNPLGVRAISFKKPTEKELSHDFLWRVHAHVPGNGEMAIFNRSHYEDVLVVRVHGLAPKEIWKSRYQQIADFERMLAESGTILIKFFLHIDRDEQKKRLEARLADPTKQWKFNTGDVTERAHWDDYMEAYEEAIGRTSAAHAPWYIVPANRKWYRNLVIGTVVADALERLEMEYPEPEDLEGITID